MTKEEPSPSSQIENNTRLPMEKSVGLANMTYSEFRAAQQALRDKIRPTIPYIDMNSRSGYSVALGVVRIVESYGLESNPNIGLGGVTAFVDNEEDFAKLQKLIVEHPEFEVKLPR